MIRFTVPGRPVPYVRYTRRGQYVKVAPKRYKAYLDIVRLYARQAMARTGFEFIRKGVPIEMECRVYLCGGLDGDTSNYLKGLEDALNGVLYEDDRYIVSIKAEKIFVPEKSDQRVEVIIRRVEHHDQTGSAEGA